jgi:hypothetical protein
MPPHRRKPNAPSYTFPGGVQVSVDNVLNSSTTSPAAGEFYVTFTVAEGNVATVYRLTVPLAKWRSFSPEEDDRKLCDYLRKNVERSTFLRRFQLKPNGEQG